MTKKTLLFHETKPARGDSFVDHASVQQHLHTTLLSIKQKTYLYAHNYYYVSMGVICIHTLMYTVNLVYMLCRALANDSDI